MTTCTDPLATGPCYALGCSYADAERAIQACGRDYVACVEWLRLLEPR